MSIRTSGRTAFRDYVVDGVSSSGVYEPAKSGIRAVFDLVDAAVSDIALAGAITVIKSSKAALDADLAHAASTLALVHSDGSNSGYYVKSGGSGSGSWSAVTGLSIASSWSTDLATKVQGPASATDNAIVRYDGVTGKLTQDSAVTITDGGVLTVPAGIAQSGTTSTASGSVTRNSFYVAPIPSGTVTATYNCLTVGIQYNSASNTSGDVNALIAQADLFAAGGASNVAALRATARSLGNSSSYSTSLIGGYFQTRVEGTSSVTNCLGVKIGAPYKGGNITLAVGLYIEAMAGGGGSGAVTGYSALHIDGAGINNAITFGAGSSGLYAKIYSSAQNALTIAASAGLGITGDTTITGTLTISAGGNVPTLAAANAWTGVQAFNAGMSQSGTVSTASGSVTRNSLYVAPIPSGTVTATYNCLSVGIQYNSSSTTSGAVTAVSASAELYSTGGANQVQGIYGMAKSLANGGAYASGSLYGGRFQAQIAGTSSFNHVMGIKIDGPLLNGVATYTAGLYIQGMGVNIGTGSATASAAIHIEGSGIANCIAWGNGGSGINAALYSPSANVVRLNATAGFEVNGKLALQSVSNASPANGDVWFDGTDLKARLGGVTKTLQAA